MPRSRLIELLDRGGYARYDERTATQLLELARIMAERHRGRVSALADLSPEELEQALDALPGWGPTTVRIFLRELRGVCQGAAPPIDARALAAARHLHLIRSATRERMEAAIKMVATDAHVDIRDLEAALIRLALHHRDDLAGCAGGRGCLESVPEQEAQLRS
ncbi:MAG TPA: hypothetical protein VET26_06755 [Candidatus Sulfotelmatobacter sp.]|nr:hypothetical protein [Candidatus Sulfotelmatobacter sp.]